MITWTNLLDGYDPITAFVGHFSAPISDFFDSRFIQGLLVEVPLWAASLFQLSLTFLLVVIPSIFVIAFFVNLIVPSLTKISKW